MAEQIPITQPVGKDPDNWVPLSDKEAKIRAKAIQKGHEPHDWRWAISKVFKTRKAYPGSLQNPGVHTDEAPALRNTAKNEKSDQHQDSGNIPDVARTQEHTPEWTAERERHHASHEPLDY